MLGMALTQVHGQVDGQLRVRGVRAQRPRAERPANTVNDVGGDGLNDCPYSSGADLPSTAVERIAVEIVSGAVEDALSREQAGVDGSQVSQAMRVLTCSIAELLREGKSPSVPAGRHADRAVPKTGTGQVLPGRADRYGGDVEEIHGAGVALGHSHRMPSARNRSHPLG